MKKDDYYKSLPKKRMAAGPLLFNEDGEILILKPVYKNHWLIPGGVVEENESPREACLRETKEELNLDIKPKRLLCVEYRSDSDGRGENLQFIFDGGILSPAQINNIKIPVKEISEYRFMKVEEALPLLSESLRLRISKCLKAIKNNTTVYIENGQTEFK